MSLSFQYHSLSQNQDNHLGQEIGRKEYHGHIYFCNVPIRWDKAHFETNFSLSFLNLFFLDYM